MIGDCRRDLAAAQHEQRVAAPHLVADVDAELLHLPRDRREDARGVIRVELDGARRANDVAGGARRHRLERDLGELRLVQVEP